MGVENNDYGMGKVFFQSGNENILLPNNKESWHNTIYVGKKAKHYSLGKSAESLAKYVCEEDGIKKILDRVSKLLNAEFDPNSIRCQAEYEIKFDKYGHGREHDLAIWGTTKNTNPKRVFIGIEAKVNEQFDKTIAEKVIEGQKNITNGESTNLLTRIENLMNTYLGKVTTTDFKLRYQLLTATAGTYSTLNSDINSEDKADVAVLMVLTFNTELINKEAYKQNSKDFSSFVKRIGCSKKVDSSSIWADKVKIKDKELYIVYDKITFQ